MKCISWSIVLFSLVSFTYQLIDENKLSDDTVVIVQKAKGRIGNNLWLLMTLMNYELKFGVKAFITEQSRWIMDKYFKGTKLNKMLIHSYMILKILHTKYL